MSRIAENVQSLLEEDEEMEDAVKTILRQAEEDGGVFQWEDVEDDVSSGQWGRLIQKDVIVNVDGDDFEFTDQGAVEDALSGDIDVELDLPEVDSEESSWSQWDKLAGMAALSMMVGYYFQPVQELLGGVMNLFLKPFGAPLPFYVVILALSMVTGLYSSLVQSSLMDTEKMGKYQERMKVMQQKQQEARERGDDAELERLQEKQMEMMGEQLGMFKEQFRPMVWTMVAIIPIFLWMRWVVGGGGGGDIVAEQGMIYPIAGTVEWTATVGPMPTWIIWYFVCSMGFGQLMRKSLNISVTPG